MGNYNSRPENQTWQHNKNYYWIQKTIYFVLKPNTCTVSASGVFIFKKDPLVVTTLQEGTKQNTTQHYPSWK